MSLSGSKCVFCADSPRFLHNALVKEFEGCFVFRDGFPVTEGHLLIATKQHIATWFDAPLPLQHHLLETVNTMKDWLQEKHQPAGFNIGMNCGQAAGQTVHHLHIHLIPRYLGDCPNPRGGVRGVIPSKQSY